MNKFLSHSSKLDLTQQLKIDGLGHYLREIKKAKSFVHKAEAQVFAIDDLDICLPLNFNNLTPVSLDDSRFFQEDSIYKNLYNNRFSSKFYTEDLIKIEPVAFDSSILTSSNFRLKSDFDVKNLYETFSLFNDNLRNSDKNGFLKILATEISGQLVLYDATQNEDHLIQVFSALSDFHSSSIIIIQNIKNELENVRGRFISKIKRDLRQGYRNLIKFLFKNMDDNSGADNVLFLLEESETLLNLKKYYHAYKRNYQIFKRSVN